MGQSKDGDRGQCGIPSKKYSSITDEKLLLNSELGVDSKEIESDKMEMMLNPSKSQIEVHGAEGSYLMERSKWPTLMLPSENLTQEGENMGDLTQEESLTSLENIIVETDGVITLMGEKQALRDNQDLRTSQDLGGIIYKEQEEEDLMDNISM